MVIHEKRKHFRLKDTVGLDFFVLSDKEHKRLAEVLKNNAETSSALFSRYQLTKLLTTVNLSVGGIEFAITKDIEKDVTILTSLVLLPSEIHIFALSKVVGCMLDPEQGGRYLLSLEFELMSENSVAALSKHMDKKLDLLLKKNQESDKPE